MSTPDSLLGYGVTLGYRPVGSPQGTAYTPLGTLMEVTPPKSSVDEAETTLLNARVKSYSPGLPEFEADFKLRLDQGDAGVATFAGAIKQAPVPVYSWLLTYSDNSTHSFDGFPKSWEPDTLKPDETRTASVSLRVNTAPAFTPAPAAS